MNNQLKTPVVFIVFNRPALTRAVFEEIAKARPAQLLIVADGPRSWKRGEADKCEEVRRIATDVRWPCEVKLNFSSTNLGCRNRVITGLNWAFSEVEEAVILEDDILPDPSFFPFCQEMLARFRGDGRVGMITGFNVVQSHLQYDYSYFFSQWSHIWGWATWRDAWARYDGTLKDWPDIKRSRILGEIFPPANADYWARIFDDMHYGPGVDTWDYQWFYTNLINRSLAIVPRVNLVRNIGFGPDATHSTDEKSDPQLPAFPLAFPLKHPPTLIPLLEMDRLDQYLCGCRSPGLSERATGRIKRTVKKLLGRRG